jgi:hypothetical protein
MQNLFALLSLFVLSTIAVAATRHTQLEMAPPSAAAAQAEVQKLISSQEAAGPAVLGPLWSAMPPIRVEHALGTYHGGLFNGPQAKKSPINWYGKQIINETSEILSYATRLTTQMSSSHIQDRILHRRETLSTKGYSQQQLYITRFH